jgi:hypothetical protein
MQNLSADADGGLLQDANRFASGRFVQIRSIPAGSGGRYTCFEFDRGPAFELHGLAQPDHGGHRVQQGKTPLRWALDEPHKDMAELLRRHGAKE